MRFDSARPLLLAALTLPSLCAQPYPDGSALLKQSQEAVKRFPSLRFQEDGEDRDTPRAFLKKTPVAYPAVLSNESTTLKDTR